MADGLQWDDQPHLNQPILVAAFAGWNDAGDAATGAVDWLVRHGRARRFAAIDPDEHVDYQSRRPHVEVVDGVVHAITWPANECFAATFREHDLVVVRGVEPNLRWKSFCDAVMTVASVTGCDTVVTMGALLGDVPHSRAVRVTGSTTDASLEQGLGLERSRYEGPTGIVGVLHDACRVAGIRSASLWVPVPHYVATPPSPPATRALLERLAVLAGLAFDFQGLDQLAELWRLQVDRAIADNDEVTTYVHELEARIDAEDAGTRGIVLGDHPAGSRVVPDADALADEVERFLREQDGNL
jgi:predicted ATP-grasp superfamily ATP-dependent carboligase